MQRAVLCLAVALCLCSTLSADAPGFLKSDLGKAKSEASSTGKLVFIYFNLPG